MFDEFNSFSDEFEQVIFYKTEEVFSSISVASPGGGPVIQQLTYMCGGPNMSFPSNERCCCCAAAAAAQQLRARARTYAHARISTS